MECIVINNKEKAERIISCMGKRKKRIWRVGNNIDDGEKYYIFYQPKSVKNKNKSF